MININNVIIYFPYIHKSVNKYFSLRYIFFFLEMQQNKNLILHFQLEKNKNLNNE